MSETVVSRSRAWRGPLTAVVVVLAIAAAVLTAFAWRQWEARADSASSKNKTANSSASAAKARTATDPDAASRVVEAFIADVRAVNRDFARQAAAEGYLSAIGASSLQNPAALAAAPERIRAARGLFEAARAKHLARTEAAMSALKALPTHGEQQQILVEDLLEELNRNRSARNAYWDAMLDSADGLEGMARVLIRTQGAWTADMGTRSITFVNDADAAAYDTETFRRQEKEAEADRRLGQLNRSADALTTIAKRWGE